MTNADVVLELEHFACRRGVEWLFDALSLQVLAGDCWALRGPNGCGKTTLLRSIAGLFADHRGHCQAAASAYLGHRSGVMRLSTPRQMLQWYAALLDVDVDVAAALARVGLAGFEDVGALELSAGQVRRLALARLALQRAPLWLLDEPYTALDTAGQRLVDHMLSEHCRGGGAVIAATHQSLGVGDYDPLRTRIVRGAMRLDKLEIDG